MLHGLDEGMTQKLNYGVLHMFMDHVHATTGMPKTTVGSDSSHSTTPMSPHGAFLSHYFMHNPRYGIIMSH